MGTRVVGDVAALRTSLERRVGRIRFEALPISFNISRCRSSFSCVHWLTCTELNTNEHGNASVLDVKLDALRD